MLDYFVDLMLGQYWIPRCTYDVGSTIRVQYWSIHGIQPNFFMLDYYMNMMLGQYWIPRCTFDVWSTISLQYWSNHGIQPNF